MPSPNRHPTWWIPSVYLAEGLPYAVVTGMVAVALLDFGFTAGETAAYSGVLALPWAFKPFWAFALERYGTRRGWIIAMQGVMTLLLIAVALVLPSQNWLPLTLSLLVGLGFMSATHDIAADGFYIEALDEHRQAEWSGIRNTFYRVANLAGNGGLVWLAGHYKKTHGSGPAWTLAFGAAALAMGLFAVYDFWAIPRLPVVPRPANAAEPPGFLTVWSAFMQKPGVWRILAFILFYRFAEGQVQSGNKAFFLALRGHGGLALGVDEVGLLYGTLGVLALTIGGIAGGVAIAYTGLGRQLWLMAAAMNLPNVLYLWMAWTQPQSRAVIGGIIFLEQFGYGYGFAAFMVYLLYVSRGEHATSHYAICTTFMALGMSLAAFTAGVVFWFVAQAPGGGYFEFFSWVMLSTLVSFAVLRKLPLDRDFGRARKLV
jgi:PAT family beta-lactamase induction signal transducer AmpG